MSSATPIEWLRKNAATFIWDTYEGKPHLLFEAFIKDLVLAGVINLQNGRNRGELGETALTDLLIAPLQGVYLLVPEGNSNGHVDIFVKTPFPGLEWKGEAKIVKDYPWYEQGLVKLVAKYNSGSEDHTFLVGYCPHPEMHTVVANYKAKIEGGKPADFQSWGKLPSFEHANIFAGNHLASGRSLLVAHVWSNCHYATDKDVFATKSTKKTPKKKVPKPAKRAKSAPSKTAKMSPVKRPLAHKRRSGRG